MNGADNQIHPHDLVAVRLVFLNPMRRTGMRRIETLRLWVLAGMLVVFGASVAMGSQDTPAPLINKPIVTEGTGPYKVVIEGDPGLPDHTIYRPENVEAVKGKMPIVSWANGGCSNSSNSYRPFLSEIASHGFLVLAIGPAASVLNSPPPTPGAGPGGPGRAGRRPRSAGWWSWRRDAPSHQVFAVTGRYRLGDG